MSIADCPVFPLAALYDKLAAQWSDDDNHHRADTTSAPMAAIIDAASYLTPKSAAGLAFQIMAAAAQVDNVQNAIRKRDRKKAAQRLERLLYRAFDPSKDQATAIPNAAAHLMPERLDTRA